MSLFKKIGKAVGNIISSSPAGGLFDSFSGRSQQEDANRQAMLAWNLANDYNHPIQQMERLKAAGLNPLLVYGSGSVTGNTTSQPALVGGGISTPLESTFKGLSNVMSLAQGKANLDNTHAQTQASNAGAVLSGAQAANVNAQTAINEKKADYEEKSLIADIDYKNALTKQVKQNTEKSKYETDLARGEAFLFGDVGGTKGATTFGSVAKNTAQILRGLFRK